MRSFVNFRYINSFSFYMYSDTSVSCSLSRRTASSLSVAAKVGELVAWKSGVALDAHLMFEEEGERGVVRIAAGMHLQSVVIVSE